MASISLQPILRPGVSPDQIVSHCCEVLNSLLSINETAVVNLTSFVDQLLVDSISVAVSRRVLSHVVTQLKTLPGDMSLELCIPLLNTLRPRMISFEEQMTDLHQHVAELYEGHSEYCKAALQLAAVPLENSQRNYSKEFKLQTYLKIAHLFLEGRDAAQAEVYINRASLLVTTDTEPIQQVQYRQCYARVLDYRKKFLEAAKRYAELSLDPHLTSTEKESWLRQAVLCAIIAPAGAQRSRILATLSKDERSHSLPFHTMLKNTQLGRMVPHDQVVLFEEQLAEHQKAKLPDGMSIVDAAVMEHNVMAVSSLYNSITLESLGDILSVSKSKAERVVGEMIAESRLKGHIDQIEQLVYFEEPIPPWDSHINIICNKVNNIIDLLNTCEPDYTKDKLAQYQC